jgi:chromosome condensin MukBEF complex kleisin-like MukF subunit
MLEYVFFDESILKKFIDFSVAQGVEARRRMDEALIVAIPEDLEPAVEQAIDIQYEHLLQETASLLEEGDDALEKNVAGVQITLSNGQRCTIRLDPDFVARILTAISMDELRDMVQHVADGVENPDERPLCHD